MTKTYSQADIDEIRAERDALKMILAGNFGAIINIMVCLDEPGSYKSKVFAVRETVERMMEPGEQFAPNIRVLFSESLPGKH